MNILYQCSEYPPFRNGGIGTVTKIVAEEMARRGHKVYVVGYYPNMEGGERKEVINRVTVYRFNLGLRRGNLRLQMSHVLNRCHIIKPVLQRELTWYENNIEKLIKENNIELLEMTDFYAFNNYNARLRYRRFSVPTIMRVHGSTSFILHYSGEDKPIVYANDRDHFSRMDWLCSVSSFAESYINEFFPDLTFRRKKVIYNPIEDSFLKHNNPSLNKNILFIGRLIKTKGVFSVTKAFEMLHSEYPDWRLRIAGGGDVDAVRSTLHADTQKSVDFLGFCNRQAIADEIDNCAFACIPTYFENFSMVPLEIMGRFRAIIFTNRTSGNEIIKDGEDGFTVNPEDINDICTKMRILIENSEKRNDFAERGYKKVSNCFTTESISKDLESFYSMCLNEVR